MKRIEMKLLKAPVVADKAVRAGPSSYPISGTRND